MTQVTWEEGVVCLRSTQVLTSPILVKLRTFMYMNTGRLRSVTYNVHVHCICRRTITVTVVLYMYMYMYMYKNYNCSIGVC